MTRSNNFLKSGYQATSGYLIKSLDLVAVLKWNKTIIHTQRITKQPYTIHKCLYPVKVRPGLTV